MTIAAALLFVFFLVVYGAIHVLVRSQWLLVRAQSAASERTGYDVQVKDLRLSPWLSLIASGIFVSKNGQVLFQGERVICFISPFDVFQRRISRLSLEKPVVHLSLQDLFAPSESSSPRLSIGSLNIDGGEFVLDTGYGEPLALRSIALRAKNLNLGGATGVDLRTYVPAVNGNARISISGGVEEKRIEIGISQGGEKLLDLLRPKAAEEKNVLNAVFQLIKRDGDVYAINGSGAIDQFRWGGESIGGKFSSRLELDAKVKSLLIRLDLQTTRVPLKFLLPAIPIDLGASSATLQGEYSAGENRLALRKFSLKSSAGTLDAAGTLEFGQSPMALNTALRLRDVAIETLKPLMPVAFRALAYHGRLAANLTLSGAMKDPVVTGLAWNDELQAVGERISVERLSFKMPFQWNDSVFQVKEGRFHGRGLLFGRKGETQWRAREATLAGDVIQGAQAPFGMVADFQIFDGGFSAPGESKVGEHLNVRGSFTCRNCDGEASFEGEARVDSLELLWNKFFGDFKDQKPAIKVNGTYQRHLDRLGLNLLQVSLGSLGRVQVRGAVDHLLENPTFNLEARADDLRPAGLYDFFVRDTFKAGYPLLGQIGLSGKSDAAVRVQGSPQSFVIEGKVRLEEVGIEERSGRWRIGPIALDLPLKLRSPGAPKDGPSGSPRIGRFSIREVKTSSISVPEVSAPVILWNNALRFPEAIQIALFGGSSTIERLAWSDVIGAPSDFSFSLGLKNLRLLDLTEALGWYRFDGSLSGSIPEVQWAGDSLKSSGSITLNVFGGRVAITGMEIERPLSPVRSVKMSARLEGLDLEQASATFEFGRISGILAGRIDDLVMTNGQPAQFKADIQTVGGSGASHWISVEALNKITVLSSGNQAGFVYGGIAGFFDFFRYSKLGFKANLKNDRMILRGIETKNGQEYLVVGTLLPPTVNIVSHTQEIGFSELLRRLEQVKEAGSSGPGQP